MRNSQTRRAARDLARQLHMLPEGTQCAWIAAHAAPCCVCSSRRTAMVFSGYRQAVWQTSPTAPLMACTARGWRNLQQRNANSIINMSHIVLPPPSIDTWSECRNA